MTTMIAAITGLAAEARLLTRLGWRVEVGGGTPAGAEAAALRAVSHGATALISFGLAGGLDPAWRPGAILVPAAVIEGGALYRTEPALSALLGGADSEMLYAGDSIAAEPAQKQRIFQQSQCCAIDLESGAVARVASARGLGFAALRAICDPAERALPKAALAALDSQGGMQIARIAWSVIRAPGQIPGLLAVGRDAAKAKAALVSRVNEILLRLR